MNDIVYQEKKNKLLESASQLVTLYLETREDRYFNALLKQLMPLIHRQCRYFMTLFKGGIPFETLKQAGIVGLYHAVLKYEEEKGANISTYAEYWIRATINQEICSHLNNRRRAVDIRSKISKAINDANGTSLSDRELAERTGLSEVVIERWKNDVSYEKSLDDLHGDLPDDHNPLMNSGMNVEKEVQVDLDRKRIRWELRQMMAAVLTPHQYELMLGLSGFDSEEIPMNELAAKRGSTHQACSLQFQRARQRLMQRIGRDRYEEFLECLE